jgi:hypothetical protein
MGKITPYKTAKKYKDKWVAIYNKNVVSVNSSLEEVVKEAKRKIDGKQTPVFL